MAPTPPAFSLWLVAGSMHDDPQESWGWRLWAWAGAQGIGDMAES